MQIGDIAEGTIQSIKPYGAFIDLGKGMSGLLHISQISYDRITNVGSILSEGDKLKVCQPIAHVTCNFWGPAYILYLKIWSSTGSAVVCIVTMKAAIDAKVDLQVLSSQCSCLPSGLAIRPVDSSVHAAPALCRQQKSYVSLPSQ